jgi:hypothetical protein
MDDELGKHIEKRRAGADFRSLLRLSSETSEVWMRRASAE